MWPDRESSGMFRVSDGLACSLGQAFLRDLELPERSSYAWISMIRFWWLVRPDVALVRS